MFFKYFLDTPKFQVAVLVEDRTTQKYEHNKIERELMFNFQKIPILL